MHCVARKSLTSLYIDTLNRLRYAPELETRAGKTRELLNISTKLTDIRSRFIIEPHRNHSLQYLKDELIWYMNKDRRIHKIKESAKFWETVSDDSYTVNSNYGEKVFRRLENGKSQYDMVLQELTRDPSSRRAIWHYFTSDEYEQMHWTKDFPCTQLSQFFIRKNRLHQTVYIRSNDLIFGWSNDMPFYTFMQEMLALELGVKPGYLQHVAGSLHIYERHYNKFKCLENHDFPFSADLGYYDKQRVFPKMTLDDVDYLKNMPYGQKPDTEFCEYLFSPKPVEVLVK